MCGSRSANEKRRSRLEFESLETRELLSADGVLAAQDGDGSVHEPVAPEPAEADVSEDVPHDHSRGLEHCPHGHAHGICPHCGTERDTKSAKDAHPEFLYDSRGNALFYDPPYEAALNSSASDAAEVAKEYGVRPDEEKVPLADLPIYHSYPEAPNILYLDFDGGFLEDTDWNLDYGERPIHSAPFDVDGDRETWTETELEIIREVWLRVSEDFLPFEINVTTEEPDPELLNNPRGAIRAMITNNFDDELMGGSGEKWHVDVGGVAYTNSWVIPDQAPVWVFYNLLPPTAKGIAEATTHEFGHAFGLVHHGQGNGIGDNEYYDGHGEGETSWAPIMGTGYTSNVTQWSRGDYSNASNDGQDDFELITNDLLNRIEFREDDIFQGNDDAMPIEVVDGVAFGSGVIAEEWDYDTLSFEHPGGPVNLHIAPASVGPNLDVLVTLYDEDSDELAQFDPIESVDVWVQTELPAGTYYVDVEGGKYFPEEGEGYSDYGSVGSYTITGHVGVPPLTVVAGGEYGWREDTLLYRMDEGDDLTLDASLTYGPSDQLTFAWDINGDGEYTDLLGANPSISWEELSRRIAQFDSGEYEIGLQVSDDQGNIATGAAILDVRNLRPEIGDTEPREVLLAERTRFEVNATDSPGDVLSYEWKVYSVSLLAEEEIAEVETGAENSFHYVFDEPGSYEVRVRVSDEDGGSRVRAIPVTVLNENPVPRILEANVADGDSLSVLSSLVFSFNQDVSDSLDVTNLVVFDRATNFPIDLSGRKVMWDSDAFTAEYEFDSLPVGNYQLSLDGVNYLGVRVDGDGDGFSGGKWTADITIESTTVPGDINFDGVVDFSDFLILSEHYGSMAATADEGDITGDGVIDFSDFLIVSKNFGQQA